MPARTRPRTQRSTSTVPRPRARNPWRRGIPRSDRKIRPFPPFYGQSVRTSVDDQVGRSRSGSNVEEKQHLPAPRRGRASCTRTWSNPRDEESAMRNSPTSPSTGTSGITEESMAGHGPGTKAARRRVALVTVGAAVCALGGAALGGFGSPTASVASASGITPGLPSGFPSGTPALPGFPSSAEALASGLTSGHHASGSVSAHGNGASGNASAGTTGGLPSAQLPSTGGTGVTSLVPTGGLPAVGGASLPVPTSVPGVPSLPVSPPAGLPAIPAVPSLPVAGLVPTGGSAPTCVSTPPVPASPLGALPVTAGGSGSVTSPIGGISVTVSTSGATVCAS